MEKINEQRKQTINLFEMTIDSMRNNIIELSKKYLEEIFKENNLYRDYFEEIFGYEYETIDKNFNLDSLMKLYILSNGGFSLAYVYNNDNFANFATIKENLIRDISNKDMQEFNENALELFKILKIKNSKDLKNLVQIIKDEFGSNLNMKEYAEKEN